MSTLILIGLVTSAVILGVAAALVIAAVVTSDKTPKDD